jgi:hypothetical protein
VRSFLAGVLILLIATSASARAAFASTEHDNKQAVKLRMEVDSLPRGTFVKVKLKDHSKVEGELIAHSEETFELAAPGPVTVSYVEAKSIAEDPAGQSVPGKTQNPPAHHHRIMKYVVIIAVVLGLTVALASLDR